MPGEASTDLELIESINAGLQPAADRAFESLYHRHKDFVYRVAYRYCGDADFAADATAETFAYLVRQFPGFALTARMTTFLYPVTKHNALATKRKAKRGATSPLDDAAAAIPAATPTPSTAKDDLTVVLARLSEDHREVVLLRFVDELTLQEIAEATDVALGTVKSRLHHALKQLREDEKAKKFFLP